MDGQQVPAITPQLSRLTTLRCRSRRKFISHFYRKEEGEKRNKNKTKPEHQASTRFLLYPLALLVKL